MAYLKTSLSTLFKQPLVFILPKVLLNTRVLVQTVATYFFLPLMQEVGFQIVHPLDHIHTCNLK